MHYLHINCKYFYPFGPTSSEDIFNQELTRGFSIFYPHYNECSCSPRNNIPQTWKFLCVLQTPDRTWNRRRSPIGGHFNFEARGWRICVHFIDCKPSIGRRAENLHVKPTHCAGSYFLIGNDKCKQHSDWSELELSTADRVIPTRETK